MEYFDASAKLNQGVNECFGALVTQICRKQMSNNIIKIKTPTVTINRRNSLPQPVTTERKCCK
jgi:hypothetical protein